MNKFKNCSYRQYLNYLTYEKLYNKVQEIEEHEIKYKFIVICDFLKEKLSVVLLPLSFVNYKSFIFYKYIIIYNIYVLIYSEIYLLVFSSNFILYFSNVEVLTFNMN
jgi:hypothetical protein